MSDSCWSYPAFSAHHFFSSSLNLFCSSALCSLSSASVDLGYLFITFSQAWSHVTIIFPSSSFSLSQCLCFRFTLRVCYFTVSYTTGLQISNNSSEDSMNVWSSALLNPDSVSFLRAFCFNSRTSGFPVGYLLF